jgi:hypothetical protein
MDYCYMSAVVNMTPPRPSGLEPRPDHGVFLVSEVVLGQVFFSEYFGFPCLISFHQLLVIH